MTKKTVLIVQGLIVVGMLADDRDETAKEALAASGLTPEDAVVLTDAEIHYGTAALSHAGVLVVRKDQAAAVGLEGRAAKLTGEKVQGAMPRLALKPS